MAGCIRPVRLTQGLSFPAVTEGIWSVWVESQGLLYFVAGDGAHGRELWRTDGTPAGTFMVADVRLPEGHSANALRVAAHIKCQCGCTDSVATCSMLECHFSKPAKEKIAQMQVAGQGWLVGVQLRGWRSA